MQIMLLCTVLVLIWIWVTQQLTLVSALAICCANCQDCVLPSAWIVYHLTSYLALYTKPCFPRGLICIDSNSHGTSRFAAYMPFALLIDCTVISSTFQPCPCMLSVCLLLSVPCHCLKIWQLCPTLCSQSCWLIRFHLVHCSKAVGAVLEVCNV